MIEFQASVPFPLLSENQYTHQEAQDHANVVDTWLGLQIEKVEKSLEVQGCKAPAPNSSHEHQNLWIGLAPKSLLTPYIEIRSLLRDLDPKPGSTLVDLGAGYGRMAFVIGRHYPQVRFVGYEYVGERVKEGLRCLKATYENVELHHVDLSHPEFEIREGEFFFIYDYGTPKAIEKTLYDLRRVAATRPIAVVGRGRSSRDIIERHHPWLSQIVKPQHGRNASIYRSAF